MAEHDEFEVEKVKEIFKVLSESVPQLIENVMKVLYSAAEGQEYGKAVAGFYQALKAAGMSNEQAFELTKEYMSNLSIGGLLKGAMGMGKHDESGDEMGRMIKEKVKREMEKELRKE